MMKQAMKALLMTGAIMISSACTGEDDPAQRQEEGLREPLLEQGKADRLGAVEQVALIPIGEEHGGEFSEDLQFFGHTFFAGVTGSQVDIEVTQRGSSRGLDTSLFLYGERAPGDWQRLMVDDDDGYGALSKLEDVEFLGDFTRYMAVVGTKDGMGRGRYNLEIRCASGGCIAPPPSGPASCPQVVGEWIEECMADYIQDTGDFTGGAEACAGPDVVETYFKGACDVGPWGQPEAFCASGFVHFKDVLYPVCAEDLGGPSPDVFTLYEKTPSAQLIAAVDADPIRCAYCSVYVEAFDFAGPDQSATASDVLYALEQEEDNERLRWQRRYGLNFTDQFGAPLQSALLSELGVSSSAPLEVASMEADWEPAAGAQEWFDKTVVIDWTNQQVIVITSVTGD